MDTEVKEPVLIGQRCQISVRDFQMFGPFQILVNFKILVQDFQISVRDFPGFCGSSQRFSKFWSRSG